MPVNHSCLGKQFESGEGMADPATKDLHYLIERYLQNVDTSNGKCKEIPITGSSNYETLATVTLSFIHSDPREQLHSCAVQ